jgi:hypothetical protein
MLNPGPCAPLGVASSSGANDRAALHARRAATPAALGAHRLSIVLVPIHASSFPAVAGLSA